MIDICFVGNSSIDYIENSKGKKKVFGGSCIYSAFSCRNSTEKNILVISNANDELYDLLKSRNIDFKGNLLMDINSFAINEKDNTCMFINKVDASINIDELINTNHLHISFRKGVDIDNILDNPNINYKSLSVDVMIYSVEEFIPFLQKYSDKITTLFCNSREYFIIKEYVKTIPNIIITNEEKPVILIKNGKNYAFDVINAQSIVSTTGAGDSFIGGYLAKEIENKSFNECVIEGIKNSALSIENFGPLKADLPKKIVSSKVKHIPNNIIVIGNSCAGKTTFINFLKNLYNIYIDIDDLPPLLEMFELDDISAKGNLNDLIKIKEKMVYIKDVCDQYIQEFPNINHYSAKAKHGNGHDIIRPVLWNMILERAVMLSKGQNNIIQFSRGKDIDYENEFGGNVYEKSLQSIINILENKEDTIIVNLSSDLQIRKSRNYFRYKNGGHFVSEETMDKVYYDDIFKYEHIDKNSGFISLNGISYPVYTIFNNKTLSQVELYQFMMYNLNDIINYFNKFGKCDNNEYEGNSKRYLAKQSK